jgi:hypothetical protein
MSSDLKTIAEAGRFRLTRDESYEAERFKGEELPWLLQIPCQARHICKHSDELLAAYVTVHTRARRLEAVEGVISHDAFIEGEGIYLFPPKLIDEVAEIMGARRRRRISEYERQRLAALSKQYGFRPENHIVESDLSVQISTLGENVTLDTPWASDSKTGRFMGLYWRSRQSAAPTDGEAETACV